MADMEGVQHYIPLTRAEVKERLFADPRITPDLLKKLEDVCTMLEAIWHFRQHDVLERMKQTYSPLDPDQHGEVNLATVDEFVEALSEVLEDGNWETVTQEEIDEALEGEDVFPISLDIRFDEFVRMHLFKLGIKPYSVEVKRNFGLSSKTISGEMFERIIQVIQFRDSEWFKEQKRTKFDPGKENAGLHLRMFRDVPKLDLEVIFPNTSPKMRGQDKIKIAIPLFAGLGSMIAKYAPVVLGWITGSGASSAGFSTAALGGVVGALGGYMFKTWSGYKKTKEDYLDQVSKDMYFKGQANNQAVINMVVDLAEEQEVKEALLAYTFLLIEDEQNHTPTTLDDRVEAWLAEFGLTIDFEIDDALQKLLDLHLLIRKMKSEGGWVWDGEEWVDPKADLGRNEHIGVVQPEVALARMDEYWDGIFEHSSE